MAVSEWGYVDKATALRKIRLSREDTAKMVQDMSLFILNQEKRIDELQANVIAISAKSSSMAAEHARLLGYQERVRDVDTLRADFKRFIHAKSCGFEGKLSDV